MHRSHWRTLSPFTLAGFLLSSARVRSLLFACIVSMSAAVPADAGQAAQSASVLPTDGVQNVGMSAQYRRLMFPRAIQLVAVGVAEILSAKMISSRELLLL